MQLARRAAGGLRRRAENVLAALLGLMFLAFLAQIAFRYVFNLPVGWTQEVTVACWVWLVLWGAAFVLREDEEIRFDLLQGAAGPRGRRVMAVLAGGALLVLYGASLRGSFDYVSFMKVEKTAYLKVRFDWLYSVYIAFLAAVLARYCWLVWRALRGGDESPAALPKAGL